MIVGYSFQKPIEGLKKAGAENVYYDTSRLRTERADMVRFGLRDGDTLLLYSIRSLGGSPVADRKWIKIVEDLGVKIELTDMEYDPRPVGRPRDNSDIDPDKLNRMRAIWLDELLSERDRIQQCNGIAGKQIGRGWYHSRWPRNKAQEGSK